jgi:hypothetical protein
VVVREGLEVLARVEEDVGAVGLHGPAEAGVGHDQLLHPSPGNAVEAVLLRPLAEGRKEDGPAQVDEILLRIQVHDPEPDLPFRALPQGQVGRTGSVQRLEPEVVPILEDDGGAVHGPPGDAVRRLLAQAVELLVHERDGSPVVRFTWSPLRTR